MASRDRNGDEVNSVSPNSVLTAEEDGFGLGDDDEGKRDEEEADYDDQQPESPRFLPEAPHQLRPLPRFHPALSPLAGPNSRGREARENQRRKKRPGAQVEERSSPAIWPLSALRALLSTMRASDRRGRRGGGGGWQTAPASETWSYQGGLCCWPAVQQPKARE